MNTAPALNGERSYLHLSRADTVVAAVAALDARLDTPHTTPVVPSDLQEWADWQGPGLTSFRFVTAGGLPATAHLPTAALTPHVRAIVWELMEAVEDETRR